MTDLRFPLAVAVPLVGMLVASAGALAACDDTALSSSGAAGTAGPSDGTGTPGSANDGSIERLRAVVQERYPFDATSFTQGLELADDGTLLVGTGQEGESRLYRRTLDVSGQDATAAELTSVDLDPEFFGEGITRTGDAVWQLTWQDGTAIRRDAETLEETARATYDGEGWGVCARGDELIFSDGSSELRRMDPETMEERERFEVTAGGAPVPGLNELECVGDAVYANLFTTTDIVRIDATTGQVTALIDASALPNNAESDPNNVLNGIAHIPDTNEFLLSGKRWPDLYRVTFEADG